MKSPPPAIPGATEFFAQDAASHAAAAPAPASKPERRRAQEALKALLALTASGSGVEFFRAMVRRLSELFGVRYVLLGVQEDGTSGQLRTMATWMGDAPGADVAWPLAGTPCERLVGQALEHIPSGLLRQFPEDALLRDMGVDSFVGVPIRSTSGQPLGLLALLDTKPLPLPETHRDMLSVLAVRVGNELERLRSERAWRESEERFHQLADQTDDIFWVRELQPAPRLVYLSPAFEQVYGRPRAAFLTDPALLDRHIHPEDLPRIQRTLDHAMRSQAPRVNCEFRILRPDGTERWLEDSASIIRQADGRPCRLTGVSRDITRRKQAELGLLAEKARFRDLFEHSPDAIFLENTEGIVLDVNQAACALHGLPREQLLSRHVLELVPPVHRAAAEREFGRIAAGRIKVIEGHSLHRDGSSIPVELHASRVLHAGQPALLLHVRDITARKETELALEGERARYRSLFENSPTAIWEGDLTRLHAWLVECPEPRKVGFADWLLANPAHRQEALSLVQVLGMNRAAFGLHTSTKLPATEGVLPAAVVGEHCETFARLCEHLVRGATGFELESTSTRDNGRPLHLLLDVCVPQNAGRPDYSHTILAGTDITERRMATARLEGQRRILEMIARGLPLDTVLAELVRRIEALCDGLRCCAFLVSEDGVTLQAITAPSLPPEAIVALDDQPIATGPHIPALAARTGQMVEVTDYESSTVSEPCRRLAKQFRFRAGFSYPIRARDQRVVGVFGGFYGNPRQTPGSHLDVLETAGTLLSVAVERHAHDQAIEASSAALKAANTALVGLARSEIIAGGEPTAVLREVAEAGARGVGVARASIWFFSPDGTQLVCEECFDRIQASHSSGRTFRVADHQPYFQAIQHERVLPIGDAWSDPVLATFVEDYLRPQGIKSVLDVGIRLGERLTGIVCLQHVGPARPWSHEQVLFANSLADIFSLALQTRERQRVEAALRQSEERYRSVVDALAEGVLLVDNAGRMTAINHAAVRILGLSPEQVRERRLNDPDWRTFRPNGQPMLPGEYPANITLHTGQPQSDVVMGLRRSDQQVVWISINTRPLGLDASGRVTTAVVSFADITERHAAQQALEERTEVLRAISEAQARFIGKTDPQESFVAMVETLVRLTGSELGMVGEVESSEAGPEALLLHAVSERAKGAAAHQFFATHPYEGLRITRLDNLLGSAIRSGEPLVSNEAMADPQSGGLPDGHPPLANYLGLPLKCAGKVVGLLGLANRPGGYTLDLVNSLEPFLTTCAGMIEALRNQRQRDTAEAHVRRLNAELEQRVQERTAELVAVNNELGEFAYVVAHDLKAPLLGISQLSEWIAHDHTEQLSAEGLRYFEMLRQRLQHLHQLVDGLLVCARVGRAPEPESRVNTRKLVQQILGHLSPPSTVTVEIAPDLPTVTGNPQRLHQVFQNLLDNAIKYLDKPKGRVSVRATRRSTEWEFAVSDNGPGIPPQFHERVFQIFQRLTVDGDVPGTGLGLTLVKRIVEKRGGQVKIESQVGEGTTVIFTWPKEARGRSDLGTHPTALPTLYGEMPDRG